MKPSFSFKYGEKNFTQECCMKSDKGLVCEIEKEVWVCTQVNEYEEYNAIEWVLYFENRSNKNSQMFSEIKDCDGILPLEIVRPNRKQVGIPEEKETCVITMNGMVESDRYWENGRECADEYTLNYEYLSVYKRKSFCNRGGRSSDEIMPFFDVTSQGSGYIVAIGWTGDWIAEFEECEKGVRVETGLKYINFYLKPGEKIRTSSILIMEYSDEEDKYNKFRKLIKNHFSHKGVSGTVKEGLLAFEFFGDITSDVMKSRIIELAKRNIEFEEIWIDAAWYGKSADWDSCVGDWEINRENHPEELVDVAECAKNAGMKLMLWVEPERAGSEADIVKKNPDWFLSTQGVDQRGKILNLGNDEAWNYVYHLISDYIKKFDLACYRQDFNVPLTDYFKNNDEENRRGITEIKHITGLYRLWDCLREMYPNLIIDNCAAGGRRIDIETVKRSIPFFRSDYACNVNADPEVIQVHNNLSLYLPYNGGETRIKNDVYALRSAYSSSFGVMMWSRMFNSMSEQDLASLANTILEYRRLRKYFSGNFYNHGAKVYDKTSWTIWQYHDEETASGIIMAFRRSDSPFDKVTFDLCGIEKGKTCYCLNIDTKEQFVVKDKIDVYLPEKRSCTIIEYSCNNDTKL